MEVTLLELPRFVISRVVVSHMRRNIEDPKLKMGDPGSGSSEWLPMPNLGVVFPNCF